MTTTKFLGSEKDSKEHTGLSSESLIHRKIQHCLSHILDKTVMYLSHIGLSF